MCFKHCENVLSKASTGSYGIDDSDQDKLIVFFVFFFHTFGWYVTAVSIIYVKLNNPSSNTNAVIIVHAEILAPDDASGIISMFR